MTDEQRLDRLERIVKLMIKAGLRARRQSCEQDEKINILIDLQMRNDEKFAKYEKRFAKNEQGLTILAKKNEEERAALAKESDKKLAALAAKTEESFAVMAAAQASAEEQLKSFMATVERIITERRNGKP
jgi:hypothetical protein